MQTLEKRIERLERLERESVKREVDAFFEAVPDFMDRIIAAGAKKAGVSEQEFVDHIEKNGQSLDDAIATIWSELGLLNKLNGTI